MKNRVNVIRPGRRKSWMANMLPSAYEDDAASKVIQMCKRIRELEGLVAAVRGRLEAAAILEGCDQGSFLESEGGPGEGDSESGGGKDREGKL
jgi:hypothetical protein